MSGDGASATTSLRSPERFKIGRWHDASRGGPIVWDELRLGETIGPAEWKLEPYEAALICFYGDSTRAEYLPTALDPLPAVHPVAALWASVSVRQLRYRFAGTFDFIHDITWDRPLRCGDATRLTGSVHHFTETRGRRELCIAVECHDLDNQRVFRVEQTAVVARAPKSAVAPATGNADRAPSPAVATPAPEPLYSKTMPCHLGWARRPTFPAHPNLHTDKDAARAAGFPDVIMFGIQVATQMFEGIIDFLGAPAFYGSRIRYRLLRPVMADSTVRMTLSRPRDETADAGTYDLVLAEDGGPPLFHGSISTMVPGR